MKKVKIFISFLLFLLFTSSQVKAMGAPKAQDIPMYKRVPHMGTRTTEPSVTASLEQNQLTVNVSHYIGVANVYVYDDNGNILVSASALIEGDGKCSLDLSALESGSDKVIVESGGVTYWGILNI